jgi:hypothetical protein
MSFHSRRNCIFSRWIFGGAATFGGSISWPLLHSFRRTPAASRMKVKCYLKALASQNGFRFYYCHRASRGEGKFRTTKAGCLVKLQVLRRDGLYRVSDHRQLEYNHPLLTLTYPDFPPDFEATVRHLIRVGVDRNHLIEFVRMRTGQLLIRCQIAMLESPDLSRALTT